jgi:hypothetical protein
MIFTEQCSLLNEVVGSLTQTLTSAVEDRMATALLSTQIGGYEH